MTGSGVSFESKTRLRASKQAVKLTLEGQLLEGRNTLLHIPLTHHRLTATVAQWRKASILRFVFSFTAIECHTIRIVSFLIHTSKVFFECHMPFMNTNAISTCGMAWKTKVNFFINASSQRKGENKTLGIIEREDYITEGVSLCLCVV